MTACTSHNNCLQTCSSGCGWISCCAACAGIPSDLQTVTQRMRCTSVHSHVAEHLPLPADLFKWLWRDQLLLWRWRHCRASPTHLFTHVLSLCLLLGVLLPADLFKWLWRDQLCAACAGRPVQVRPTESDPPCSAQLYTHMLLNFSAACRPIQVAVAGSAAAAGRQV
jgi:hypothetical protein